MTERFTCNTPKVLSGSSSGYNGEKTSAWTHAEGAQERVQSSWDGYTE